ncbi:hypothetical protein D1872_348870 [compost metagenome]
MVLPLNGLAIVNAAAVIGTVSTATFTSSVLTFADFSNLKLSKYVRTAVTSAAISNAIKIL